MYDDFCAKVLKNCKECNPEPVVEVFLASKKSSIISEKWEIPFGFGSKRDRWDYLGIHPKNFKLNPNALGPGVYETEHINTCPVKKPFSPWVRKVQMENYSKFLGFRNQPILDYRAFMQAMGGPGSYDLPETFKGPVPPPTCEPIRNDFGTKVPRFHSLKEEIAPPPGTYNVKKMKTKFSDVPTMEYDGKRDRFKRYDPPYHLPPNIRIVKLPTIVDKKLTKRGPYDTFTGPRNEYNIRNHFTKPRKCVPDKYYDLPPIGPAYYETDKSKKWYGQFFREDRFFTHKYPVVTKGLVGMKKTEKMPSPDTYDLRKVYKKPPSKKYKGAFGNYTLHARPLDPWPLSPGPERYNEKPFKCTKAKRTWCMLSYRKPEESKSFSNF